MKLFSKRVISLIVAICLFLTVLNGCSKLFTEEPASEPETTAVVLPEIDGKDEEKYSCPIDFSKYRSVNREVYAYIHIPDTNIDYPINQSGQNDNYYLKRNWKGESQYRGSIFTQSCNSKSFLDPVTVIYGHNTDKGDMFSQLVKFQDADFFEKHDVFYIYTENRILVYKIISAHTYDNRHIINSYDFSNADTLLDFQQSLLNPSALARNVRSDIELNLQSKIVILSTCAEAHSGGSVRYLVNGVLVKDVPTV